jgi:hypothetical protein
MAQPAPQVFSHSAIGQGDPQPFSHSATAPEEVSYLSQPADAAIELPQGAGQGYPAASPAPQGDASGGSDGLHLAVSPYLWLAGIHGTIGALGHDASVHESFSDILKNLNIGLMVAAEPRYKKFSAPMDFMWMKLSDDKASPFDQGPTSVNVKVNQSMFTPKVAYRVVDSKMIKVDGNVGIRYFHLGATLFFEPTDILPSVYRQANWVDAIAGAKIQVALSPKVLVTVLGDAGAGGANVDYQVAGLLGLRLKHNMILQAGWRYLDVNYRPQSGFVYDVATSGLLLGLTINLK